MSYKNSIWPNGITVDENGYAVFYPLGTNKINIPKNSPHWPKGNKLIGQFVYKDDKLVGFCDTKAMISNPDSSIIVMPYEYIDTDFDSIEKDSIQIHAPKATYKKATWTDSEKIDIPDVQYKYKGCTNSTMMKNVDENFLENDIKDGKWTELLSSLTNGSSIFNECDTLSSFTSDLSSLSNGNYMFQNSSIVSFESDLSSLVYGYQMFRECSNLTTFTSDLSSLTDGRYMFHSCANLISFDVELPSITAGASMFYQCSNLTSFNSDLSSLTDGGQMFYQCSNLTTFTSNLSSLSSGYCMFQGCSSLTSFTSNLKSLTSGLGMFQGCSNLTNFNCTDLSSLTIGQGMFKDCKNLNIFNCSNLSSLTNGTYMFIECSDLTAFTSNLSSLTNGYQMFKNCKNLTTFNSNLSSLTNGDSMFYYCSNLTSFTSDLSSLTNGDGMFQGCHGFSSFGYDLSSLSSGSYMFQNCSNLTSFTSDLSSLTNGTHMFYGCKLDVPSVKNIIDTINIVSSETESPKILIAMGCDNNNTDKDLFAQEVGYSDMNTLLTALQNKGWTVSAQYNGRPSTNYSLRQPESLPVFVKLVEVSPDEEIPFYEYTSIDGSKFFNLDWFHDTTGSTDGYDVFSSLEEAIAYFNIKQIEK